MNDTTEESESDDKTGYKPNASKPNEKEDAENVDQNGSELAKLKKEFNKCNKSKSAFEREYFKCEKELRIKTEETQKLKLEIKDLRKIVKLRDEMKKTKTSKLCSNLFAVY